MRQRRAVLVSLLFLLSLGVTRGTALAQWTTQSVTLQPGWNAVYLWVQPSPDDPASVFAGLPVESAWAWNRRVTTVQYIQDPTTLVPEQPEWLRYFPAGSPHAGVTNLFAIAGGQAYLVKLGGDAPQEWTVRGRPVIKHREWFPESFNLVGFPVDPAGPPTFQDYFAPSPAHSPLMIFRLNTAGQWEPVANPSAETIRLGEAYWVYCHGTSDFDGPISVALEQAGTVAFGKVLTEQTLRFSNRTGSARTLTIVPLGSEEPPDPTSPVLAGDVPLSHWDGPSFTWVPWTGSLVQDVAGGGEVGVRVAVRRPDMMPFTPPAGAAGALYQSLLQVTDGQGTRLLLPVSAEGLTSLSAGGTGLLVAAAAAGPTHPRAGLWVGTARLDHVSQPSGDNPNVEQPTASDMDLRLILHVDGAGQVQLLQQVLLVWKEGTRDAEGQVVEPGRYVLLTSDDPALLAQYTGATVRGGQPVGRRISTAAFAFRSPIAMTGDLDAALSCQVVTGYDDPLNPFKHRYHPDHDNLDYDFQTPLPEGKESYTITRSITLTATADDPQGFTGIPGWGDDQLGGEYRETIEGVHKQQLFVKGTYRLRRVSPVAVLNDGL